MATIKGFQNSLRVLIAGVSVFGFVGGWALLAHAGKPAPANPAPAQSAPAPDVALPTLVPFDGGTTDLQPLPALPQMPAMSFPVLRTRGS